MTWCEQLGEAHRIAAAGDLETVVLGHETARRQPASLFGDALGCPAKVDLGLEQPVALAAVLDRLAGEAGVRVCRQGAESTPSRRAHGDG
jgi:hypothetical protein